MRISMMLKSKSAFQIRTIWLVCCLAGRPELIPPRPSRSGPPGCSAFSNKATSILVKLPDSLDGWSLGGGAEAKLGGPWTLKLEYRWTHLEGGSGRANIDVAQCCFEGRDSGGNQLFRNINSNASADFDFDEQTVRGALAYHFWSGGGGYGG